MDKSNQYTSMQRGAYALGTSNHLEHNDNPDYWKVLLGPISGASWDGKKALDFACGKGRNVINLHSLAKWKCVDGIDLSEANIAYCRQQHLSQPSQWYVANGVDLQPIADHTYDFVMSTIALQHIPVYDIRRSILSDILRVLVPGGLFSFQMGFGVDLSDPYGRPKSSYFDNALTASGTNSEHDVRVQSEVVLVDDLLEIGYIDIQCTIRPSFSDAGHPDWIYCTCRAPLR